MQYMRKEIKYMRINLLFIILLINTSTVFSQEEINLYDGHIPNVIGNGPEEKSFDAPFGKVYYQVATPTLKVFEPAKDKNTGAAVILCPGGSYSALVYGFETKTAEILAENGIVGIVLKYRLPDPRFYENKEIVPLQDVQQALIKVRENASKWGIDPQKVGILGSSAGGHLAATAGTHFEKCYVQNPNNTSVRPDFLVLNYPVISLADSLTHYQSRLRLIGEEPIPDEIFQLMVTDSKKAEKMMAEIPVPQDKILEFSNELHVSSETPPTFIDHANDDTTVSIQNSILFIAALQQNEVDVDCFFYANGGHGYLADNLNKKVEWIDSCIEWIKEEIK